LKVLLSMFLIALLMIPTSCGKDIDSAAAKSAVSTVSTENSTGLSQDSGATIKGNLAIKDESGNILLDKSDIISAQVHYDKHNNSYGIKLTTNSKGTAKVSDYTKAMIGQQAFVYLDDDLISSPMIVAQITNSSQVIGGDFSKEDVSKLCLKINNGQ
jgi:preprotein translocase subunit SecD